MPKRVKVVKILFKLASAQAIVRIMPDDTAKLSNLYVQQRGRGEASALLAEITEYADNHELILWLEVQRYGDPHNGLDNSQLIRFYEKFGFDVLDDGKKPVMMHRYPLLKGDSE